MYYLVESVNFRELFKGRYDLRKPTQLPFEFNITTLFFPHNFIAVRTFT